MNQQKRNYQRELDQLIAQLEREGRRPSLLLHSCCGPCSSYVLEYLSKYFQITVLYYNPNIYPPEEFYEREAEQKRLIGEMEAMGELGISVAFLQAEYEPREFYEQVKGHEKDKEGGDRCYLCYEQRLLRTALGAKKGGFDYFTTTLSISPMKNAAWLNEIGERVGREIGIAYLVSDFKKKDGYKRSTQLSSEHGIYRQDYCGCVFSLREREEQKAQKIT